MNLIINLGVKMFQGSYCRLCAVKTESFINIYAEEGEKLNLSTKIIQCLQIWLYPEDVLPKTICIDCCSKVNLFFDFFQLSSQSQISLMSMYNKEKDEEEKTVINEIGQLNNGNSLDPEYEDNTNKAIGEECIEYTNLGIPEKNTSKRKLRTPIKHMTAEESMTTQVDWEQHIDQLNPINKNNGRKRKNKGIELIREDEEEQNEPEDDDNDDDDGSKNYDKEDHVWKCTDCSDELKTLAELRKHHTEVHNQDPVFACLVCSKTYTRYRSYARHVKIHNNPRQFSCDICGKRFSQKTVLQSHATVHTEERPHSCPQCGKTFKQLSSLYLHSKRHLPPQSKPKFICSECPKEFSTKHTLETHLKMHSGERNFVCDICGKSFIAKNSLDYHIMTHGDTKPHTCDVCGKSFKTTRLLSKHSTLHTGIKPHQCDVCGKQFRERGALKEHNRIHTGAMPYSCDFCGKLFRFKGILTVHRRQHTGERPYNCAECCRDFTNWANYNKHMKRRHRDSEHNSQLAARLVQREAEHIVVPPPELSQAAPLLMHAPSHYDTVEEDIYRVPNYVPSMSYYIPPTMVQARSQ